ncbi:MAG TPA: class F sortase, partial [Actinomycetes bacterium]|nr:class F sortase [Actinomycetes bacterium]
MAKAVLVERAGGARLRFLVEQARSFPKAGFPTAAVFGPVPSAALRLVTCAGDFDRTRGSYRDNLVAFARLAAVGRRPAGRRDAGKPWMIVAWEPGPADEGHGRGGCCSEGWRPCWSWP